MNAVLERRSGVTQTKALTTIFDYHSSQVRVIGRDDGPWFVARDVCTILEIVNVSQAVEKLDADEKGLCSTYTPGGSQSLLCVNEPGVYRLIFQSRKAEAKAFTRWVTHEVLPAIRTTGTYAVGAQAPAPTLRERLHDRLSANQQNIPADCFTIGEVALRHVEALLDAVSGLDASAMLEQSIAQRFARYAKEDLHIPEEHRRKYSHMLPTGRVVQAWAYERRYLPLFVHWLWTVYFPQHFPDYARYRARYIARYIELLAPKERERLPTHSQRFQVIQQPFAWE
jgi:prophage antirepressor-like protein